MAIEPPSGPPWTPPPDPPRSWGESLQLYCLALPLIVVVCILFTPLILAEKFFHVLEDRGWKRRNMIGHGQRPIRKRGA